jgi:hypothetical protein
MPRTILGQISGNSGVGNELTPNTRGQIEGSLKSGAFWQEIRDTLKILKSTARHTIRLAPVRVDGETRPRSGRPLNTTLGMNVAFYAMPDITQRLLTRL